MLQQPLRVGGMALGCAVATATLAMVTFLVSNVVLAVVAGIGLVDVAGAPARGPEVQGVLLSAERDGDEPDSDPRRDQVCPRRAEHRTERDARVRCGGQRVLAEGSRP